MSASAVATTAARPADAPSAAAIAARLAALRARPAREGEARAWLWDPALRMYSVKLLPGEYHVASDEDVVQATTLGSCVSACLFDRAARLGGMNHFMLPGGDVDCGRFGTHAMELLINELLRRGARRERLEAKVFGGGRVMQTYSALNIGERNVEFTDRFLAIERIPLVSRDVLGVHPRKVILFPTSGRALVRKLPVASAAAALADEDGWRDRLRARGTRAVGSHAGEVELF